jgi:hypothetical protein
MMARITMDQRDKSIFALNSPPLRRILGANVIVWALAVGLWWRTLQIEDIHSIPASRRFGPLTSDIAFLLGMGLVACAVWALWEIGTMRWRKWSASIRFGLLGTIAGIGANAAAMMAAAQRIWELGS